MITLTAEFEGYINLSRYDELEKMRLFKKDERFNTMLDKTIPLWMCAEVDWYGGVSDF